MRVPGRPTQKIGESFCDRIAERVLELVRFGMDLTLWYFQNGVEEYLRDAVFVGEFLRQPLTLERQDNVGIKSGGDQFLPH